VSVNPYEDELNRRLFDVIAERVERECLTVPGSAEFEGATGVSPKGLLAAHGRGDAWCAGTLFSVIARMGWGLDVTLETGRSRVPVEVDLRGVLAGAIASV